MCRTMSVPLTMKSDTACPFFLWAYPHPPHSHWQFSPHIFKIRPSINHIFPPTSPFTLSFSLHRSHTSSLSSLCTCVAAAMKARTNCDAVCIQDVSWALLYVFITRVAPIEKWGILSTCQRSHTKSPAHLKQGCTSSGHSRINLFCIWYCLLQTF